MSLDGEHVEEEHFLLAGAGTVPEIGLGLAPFHQCRGLSRRFAFVGQQVSPLTFVLELARVPNLSPDSRLRVRPDCQGWDVDIESVSGDIHGGCGYEFALTQYERGPLRFTVTEESAYLRASGVACGEYDVRVRPETPSCFDRRSANDGGP